MTEPIAYLNGSFIPASQAAIPVTDLGFMQGVTVAEQLRTFAGKLFRIDRHLDRLARSLAIIGVDPGLSRGEFARIAEELVARNYPAIPSGGDLGLSMFVTPGPYATFASAGHGQRQGPFVGMHTYALPFHTWAAKYDVGESLVVSSVEQVPATCWPPELKCRSRVHYYLADRDARQRIPGARAILLDQEGFVMEASTANVVIYEPDVGLISPPKNKILPGISVATLAELADRSNIAFVYRDVTVDALLSAREVLMCSTSPCVWSVTQVNGQAIGSGRPGGLCSRLQQAWSEMVGFDIVAQAKQFAAA